MLFGRLLAPGQQQPSHTQLSIVLPCDSKRVRLLSDRVFPGKKKSQDSLKALEIFPVNPGKHGDSNPNVNTHLGFASVGVRWTLKEARTGGLVLQ